MPYYYKRPQDWLWHRHETSSLAEDVASGRLRPDWRYRVEGDPQERSLAELLGAERAHQSRPLTLPFCLLVCFSSGSYSYPCLRPQSQQQFDQCDQRGRGTWACPI